MKSIYFDIPYNGVNVSKIKYIIPKYTLPAKDWIIHNQININSDQTQIVAFIRNPLERVIFQYQHQLKSRPALKQYPLQFKDWCYASFNTNRVDKFMQNNPKDFLSQTEWIDGIKMKTTLYPLKQKLLINDYYDSELIKLIRNFYEPDFKIFSNVYF